MLQDVADRAAGQVLQITMTGKAVLSVFVMVASPRGAVFSRAAGRLRCSRKLQGSAELHFATDDRSDPARRGAVLPGVELNTTLALLPVLNTSLVSKEIMTGTYHWKYIALIFMSSCIYAAAAIAIAVNCFSGKTCCSERRKDARGKEAKGQEARNLSDTSRIFLASLLPCLLAPLLPCLSVYTGTRSLVMFLPGIREAADGFPEAHGKFGNSLQTLDGPRRKPVAPGQQQFGIAEDAGQRIIDFVPQYFAEITR